MRIAATADLHYTATQSSLKDQLGSVRDEADVLIVAGDLTNFGQPDEMEPLLNVLVRLRLPIIAVLGNHVTFICRLGKVPLELQALFKTTGISPWHLSSLRQAYVPVRRTPSVPLSASAPNEPSRSTVNA